LAVLDEVPALLEELVLLLFAVFIVVCVHGTPILNLTKVPQDAGKACSGSQGL
jgi:hypothetical protein